LVKVAAAEQEEEQHHDGIKIGVLRVIDGLGHGHDEREQDADSDRHIHVGAPLPKGADGASEKWLACIGDSRERNQGRNPVEEVARLR
jgi:hypothetical protein